MLLSPANRSWAHLVLLFCLVLATLWLLVGCKMPAPLPAQPTSGQSASTPISGTQTPVEAGSALLPQALYFLRQDANGLPQVWRLSPDGKALLQLTFSTTPVRDFDISSPGRLAYVAAGSLVVYSLVDSTSETWWDSPEYQPDTYPHAPRWSPDGETLAYASDGVWLRRGEDIRLLYPDPVERGQRTFPYSWSPDGHWLLVSQDQEQGTTLAILEANTGKLVLLANAPLCCQAAWTPDSQGLFVANPYPQQGPSGLWWASINNLAAPLLPWQAEDGTYNVVGWPHVNQNGLLGYAFANFPASPPDTFPFGLYSANLSSPTQRQALRLESFFLREVLWTPDGRRALLVIPAPGSAASQVSGPVVLVSAGQQPGLVLSDSGYNLRWGP